MLKHYLYSNQWTKCYANLFLSMSIRDSCAVFKYRHYLYSNQWTKCYTNFVIQRPSVDSRNVEICQKSIVPNVSFTIMPKLVGLFFIISKQCFKMRS